MLLDAEVYVQNKGGYRKYYLMYESIRENDVLAIMPTVSENSCFSREMGRGGLALREWNTTRQKDRCTYSGLVSTKCTHHLDRIHIAILHDLLLQSEVTVGHGNYTAR